MPSMSSMFSDLKYRLRAIFRRKSMESASSPRSCGFTASSRPRNSLRRGRTARRSSAARPARDRRRRAGQGRMPRGSRRRRARIDGRTTSATGCGRFAEGRALRWSSSARWRWASAPIRQSSALIDAVLLRMLPIDDPAGLHLLTRHQPTGQHSRIRVRRASPAPRSTVSSSVIVAAYATAPINVSLDGSMEPTAEGQLVSGTLFSVARRRRHRWPHTLAPKTISTRTAIQSSSSATATGNAGSSATRPSLGRTISICPEHPFTDHRCRPARVLRPGGRTSGRSFRPDHDAADGDARRRKLAR